MINKRNIRNSSRRDFRRKFRNRENLIFHIKLVRWKTKKRNGCEDTGKFVLEESQWSILDNGGTCNVYTCAGRAKAGLKPKEESQWMCRMNRSYAISRPIRRSGIWITEPRVIDTSRGLTGEFVASTHLTVVRPARRYHRASRLSPGESLARAPTPITYRRCLFP